MKQQIQRLDEDSSRWWKAMKIAVMEGGEGETVSSYFGCRYENDMKNIKLGFEEMFRG